MRKRTWATTVAALLIAAACTGTPSPTPGSTPTTGATATAVATETAVPTIGPGEGALNLIIWPGYAESGTIVTEGANPFTKAAGYSKDYQGYDWVNPFTEKTGCKVTTKEGTTSDDMVTLMRQGGGSVYDGGSFSGDATNRLIGDGLVAPVDPALFADFGDIWPPLQSPPHNTVDGKHYGVSHGWGANLLMYRTDLVTPAPTSWSVVFDPNSPSKGKVTAYDSPIYIADAALYLSKTKPELGITDPYELTQAQFDAAVALLKDQRKLIGKYWSLYTDNIVDYENGTAILGTTWPYQVSVLKTEKVAVEAVLPVEGATGWADTWMMSSNAAHPNCMLLWMQWMITPQAQQQVAEYFGEAPANIKACDLIDANPGSYGYQGFCTDQHATDEAFAQNIKFWKTPIEACGDTRGNTCIDYSVWTQKWDEIKAAT
jgi:putative spermidine/putrescine transport system substrate-binding protein